MRSSKQLTDAIDRFKRETKLLKGRIKLEALRYFKGVTGNPGAPIEDKS